MAIPNNIRLREKLKKTIRYSDLKIQSPFTILHKNFRRRIGAAIIVSISRFRD